MKIENQFDLQQAAIAAAIAADDVPVNDRLKTTQATTAAFAALGIDDANYTAFEGFFNQARGQVGIRKSLRGKPIIAPAPAAAPAA